MKYVKFGTNESQASEIILGLMRISSMNAGEVTRFTPEGADSV